MHEQIYITPSHLVEQIRIPDHQGLSRQAGPPVLSRRFPQAPLRRRRPPPAGLPHSQDAHRCHPVFPQAERPRPRMVPASRRTASPPPVRDRAVWTHPRQKSPRSSSRAPPPYWRTSTQPSAAARMASRLCPWGSQIQAGPQRRQGQHPQGRPQAGGGKKTEPAHSVHPRHLPGPSSSPRRSQLSYRQTLGH